MAAKQNSTFQQCHYYSVSSWQMAHQQRPIIDKRDNRWQKNNYQELKILNNTSWNANARHAMRVCKGGNIAKW